VSCQEVRLPARRGSHEGIAGEQLAPINQLM